VNKKTTEAIMNPLRRLLSYRSHRTATRCAIRLRCLRLEDRTVPASFHGLGFLPGLTESHASGVSADGSVVAGYSGTGTLAHSFRWTAAGGMVDLGVLPGGGWGSAYGVSADGSVVVGYSSITGGYGRA
jgi:probable HAF family extracellular repeat protein